MPLSSDTHLHHHAVSGALLNDERFDDLLTGIDHPARYVGGELNSVVKPQEVRARVALAFADVYEVAESHIGLKILYDMINQHPDFAAERAYAFWPDMEEKSRKCGWPMFSLETRRPLHAFDLVGFTLQYELSYPTMLAMLQQGGIHVRAAERGPEEPIVLGGGAGAFNPEPIADFFDAFFLGDAEPAIIEIVETIAQAKENGLSRADTLVALARLDGIYVPSHYQVRYEGLEVKSIEALPHTPKAMLKTKHGTPRVTRVTLADLDAAPFPLRPIVPNIKPVHDRVAVEIQRGCSQACRFCQAGMITRPTRQRTPETVLRIADETLKHSGKDEIGLLSLSAGDYQPINYVLSEFFARYKDDKIGVGLPSMRTETMTPELAKQVAQVRKTGFTFAPEAGSERMRRVINKTNSEADLMQAVEATARAGWRHLKFYFMIGLPTETLDDVDAIAALAERARDVARKIRPDINVTVSVSTFIPKPHTAFQWESQGGVEETREKHARLRQRLRRKNIGFRYHDVHQSFLEGILSRGDRRLADLLEDAMERGCRFDAWNERYNIEAWKMAFVAQEERHGVAMSAYLNPRPLEGLLAWDHLDAGILKKFLKRDRTRAYAEGDIEDCALTAHCYACGGCDLGDPYRAKKRHALDERQVELQPLLRVVDVEDGPLSHADPKEVSPLPSLQAPGKRRPPSATLPLIPTVARVRIRYAKVGRAFHFSHLGVKEHIERALRMVKVPVGYTRGFSPRPKLSFSPACPTGVASESEYLDIDCIERVDPDVIMRELAAGLPEGIVVLNAELVDPKGPMINHLIISSAYTITLPESAGDNLEQRLSARLEEVRHAWIAVVRKEKRKLLHGRRHFLEALVVGERRLHLRLAFLQSGSLKPHEALTLLLGEQIAEACRIRKSDIELAEEIPETLADPLPREGARIIELLAEGRELRSPRKKRAPSRGRKSFGREVPTPRVVPYAE